MKPPLLLVVDGHAYAYRAFYAIRELRGPDGAPTNAVFGFIKMLRKLSDTLQPTHRLVVWDGGLAQGRTDLLPAYKAQRPATPPDLESQLPAIDEFLAASRIATLRAEGVEADDFIGSIARRSDDAGVRTLIASSDKDFMQLVNGNVGLVNPADTETGPWGPEQVRAKTGVGPEQIVDWLSLIGDAVDNIPGVPGIGPKTATRLLSEFGSISALFERIDSVQPIGLRERLRAARPAVERNRKMIALECSLAVPPLDTLTRRDPDAAALVKLYERWGFRGLRRELAEAASGQAELF